MQERTIEMPPSEPKRPLWKRFAADIFLMPHWQKVVLAVGVLAAGLGYFVHSNPPPPPAQHGATVATPGSGFVTSESSTSSDVTPQPQPTVTESVKPWISRVGVSVVLGFIVGWLSRAFMKITAALALSFASLMGLLSYFHVLNVDLTTTVNQDYKDASAWVSDQSGRLKDAAMAHVPSGTAGLLGLYMGVRRRR